MLIDWVKESEDLVTEGALESVSALVKRFQEAEARVKTLEAQLDKARLDRDQIAEVDIPEAMSSYGVQRMDMGNGVTLSLAEETYANISDERCAAAFAWLRDKGHGAIIKNTITLQLGRQEDAKADQLIAQMREQGFAPERKEAVHPSTLKAFVKEQIDREAGLTPEELLAQGSLPRATFGVFQKRVAKLGKVKRKDAK